MSAEALREQADALEGIAAELRRLAAVQDEHILLGEDEVLRLSGDYTPMSEPHTEALAAEYPQVKSDELKPLGQFERPDYVIFVRKELNVNKVIDDAKYLWQQGKVVALQFPKGEKYKLVPQEEADD